jgi:hypothetical protein
MLRPRVRSSLLYYILKLPLSPFLHAIIPLHTPSHSDPGPDSVHCETLDAEMNTMARIAAPFPIYLKIQHGRPLSLFLVADEIGFFAVFPYG